MYTRGYVSNMLKYLGTRVGTNNIQDMQNKIRFLQRQGRLQKHLLVRYLRNFVQYIYVVRTVKSANYTVILTDFSHRNFRDHCITRVSQ